MSGEATVVPAESQVATASVPRKMVKPDITHKGFQSKEALEKATARPAPDDGEVLSGLIEEDPSKVDQEEIAAAQTEQMKLVKVRSRVYIAPFRYGPNQYTLPAGKDVLIPYCVKLHLEEKGLL